MVKHSGAAVRPDSVAVEFDDERLVANAGVMLTSTLSERLGIGDSATQRRLKNPIERGYLRNLQTQKGGPALLVVGEPVPEAISALPTPEELAAVGEG